MVHKLKFIILLLMICASSLFAQSPYSISWKRELPYLATGAGTIGGGAYLSTLPPIFTPDELLTLELDDVPGFDRFATKFFSEKADHASDVFMIGTHALPLLFLANKQTRNKFGQINLIYLEAISINFGLTNIIKSTTRRPRPFVFNKEVIEANKLTRNARTSFVSGHTSTVAVNSFFVAKVFNDFFPDSKLKPFVWGAAATLPAITGYLRVKAGKHYPSDVLAGYALGAAVGILVPQLHKSKILSKKGVKMDMGYNNLKLAWNFN